MLRAMLQDYIFESEDVVLELDVPVELAIENLISSVGAPGKQSNPKEDSMVGGVSRSETYIYRSVPGSRNSFRPTFYGYFSNSGEKSVLTGVITLNRVIKKFVMLWCGVVALMAVWTLLTVLRNPAASWGSLIYIVAMLIACIVFFRAMINKASSDKDWLKNQISMALNGRR